MPSPNNKLFPNSLKIQTTFYRLICSNKAGSNRNWFNHSYNHIFQNDRRRCCWSKTAAFFSNRN